MLREISLKERLVFALDVPAGRAPEQIELLAGRVGMVKMNSAFFGGGWPLAREVVSRGAGLFLDLKWLDIPNTLENYVEALTMKPAVPGVSIFNVHAMGARKMLEATVAAVDKFFTGTKFPRPLVIAVTIPTSWDDAQYAEVGFTGTIAEGVLRLAKLAKDCGCDGVVSSPEETAQIKDECGEKFIVVNPGIRFDEKLESDMDDQVRIASPFGAMKNGADFLVMGRPLLNGGLQAVERAYDEMGRGIAARELCRQNHAC